MTRRTFSLKRSNVAAASSSLSGFSLLVAMASLSTRADSRRLEFRDNWGRPLTSLVSQSRARGADQR